MLVFDSVFGLKRGTRVRNFNLVINGPEVHIILCSSISALDELIRLVDSREQMRSGSIVLEGKKLSLHEPKDVQYLLMEPMLFPDSNVLDNIFMTDPQHRWLKRKTINRKFDCLMQETGYELKNVKVSELTVEQQKIVEILRCYEKRPKVLLVHELAGSLSCKNISIVNVLFQKLKDSGTIILYLTSKWEDVLRVGDRITVFTYGKNNGTFTREDILHDPSRLHYLMIGGGISLHKFEDAEEQKKNQSVLDAVTEGVEFIASGSDLNNTLKFFANKIQRDMQALNCILYVVDAKSNKVLFLSGRECRSNELPILNNASISRLTEDEGICYLNSLNPQLQNYFNVPNTVVDTMLVYAIKFGEKSSGLIQVYYDNYYVYTKKDNAYLSVIAKEIAMMIENSRLEGKSVLLQESHHRIKNNLQVIISLMQMQKEKLASHLHTAESMEEMSQLLGTMISQVKSIAAIHSLLSKEDAVNSIIDIDRIIREIAQFYSAEADIRFDIENWLVPHSRATSVSLVINELISNGVKHAHPQGGKLCIEISLHRKGEQFQLRYQDNGVGFPKGFRIQESDGIGMMIINSIVLLEFEGELSCKNSKGACIEIQIPEQVLL